jgi:predicted transglutaminase-like cysteine proteinase
MLRGALAAVLLVAVPAVPQSVVSVPVDAIARAKFPHDDPATVDRIANLNRMVNASIKYESDDKHYGRDQWVMRPPDNKGDCEDYVLTKIAYLHDGQFDIIRNTKFVSVMVTVEGKADGHAILAVRLPSGAVMYLDTTPEPMTRKELVAKGYTFFDWRA